MTPTPTYDQWVDEHGDVGQEAYLDAFPFDADPEEES